MKNVEILAPAGNYESFIQEYLTGKPIQPEDNEEE